GALPQSGSRVDASAPELFKLPEQPVRRRRALPAKLRPCFAVIPFGDVGDRMGSLEPVARAAWIAAPSVDPVPGHAGQQGRLDGLGVPRPVFDPESPLLRRHSGERLASLWSGGLGGRAGSGNALRPLGADPDHAELPVPFGPDPSGLPRGPHV